MRGSGVTIGEDSECFDWAEWRKGVACEIDLCTDMELVRLRRREGESYERGMESDVFLGKMGEMRAGGPHIPCKVSRSKEGGKCHTESRFEVDPFFVIVDLTDHAEEDVVRKGIPDSLGAPTVNALPTLEDEGNTSVVDSGGIDPRQEVEGSDGAKVAFSSGWSDGGHEIGDPVSGCGERRWEGAISESLAEGCVFLEDFLVVALSACCEGVAKKELSLRRKSDGRGSFETCRPRLASLSSS